MCGLIGAAGNPMLSDTKAIRRLLVLDAIRGEDSTGLAVISEKNEVLIEKEVGHPYWLFELGGDKHPFLDEKGLVKLSTRPKVFIGHNRAATVGKVIAANAHPYVHGNVVGAQNGTLMKAYLSELDNYKDFDVDSEAVIYNISKYGKEAIHKVTGGYAITWYDRSSQKMYFINNGERPLWHTRRKDGDVIFWASMAYMLEVALSENKIEHEKVEAFQPNHLYSLDVSDNSVTAFRKIDIVDEGELKGFQFPTYTFKKNGTNGPKHSVGIKKDNRPKIWKDQEDYIPYAYPVLTHNPFSHNTQSKKNAESYHWDEKALRHLVGNTLEFVVVGLHRNGNGSEYIELHSLISTDDFEIRYFGSPKTKTQWDEFLHNKGSWKGKVKRVVTFKNKGEKETYVILDPRTIERGHTETGVKELGKPDTPFVQAIREAVAVSTLAVTTASHHVSSTSKKTNGKSQRQHSHHSADDNVIEGVFDNPIFGFQGRLLSPAEWYRAVSSGCCWCGHDPSISEHQELLFVDHDTFFCGECLKEPEVLKEFPNINKLIEERDKSWT